MANKKQQERKPSTTVSTPSQPEVISLSPENVEKESQMDPQETTTPADPSEGVQNAAQSDENATEESKGVTVAQTPGEAAQASPTTENGAWVTDQYGNPESQVGENRGLGLGRLTGEPVVRLNKEGTHYIIGDDVFREVQYPGSKRTGTVVAYYAGQVVHKDILDADLGREADSEIVDDENDEDTSTDDE